MFKWDAYALFGAFLCPAFLVATSFVMALPDDVGWVALPFLLLIAGFFFGAPQIAMLVAILATEHKGLKLLFVAASLAMIAVYWIALQDVRRSTESTAVVALPFLSIALAAMSGIAVGLILVVHHLLYSQASGDHDEDKAQG